MCYSPPLLAGFRCRWWWAVPATPGWGPLVAVVCGVLVGSLATPGGGSCVPLPATPGWVSLPLVVGGPRHSWLGSAGGGAVWCVFVCVVWLAGSGGPASRARSGAPHLFLWPLCLPALPGPLRAAVAPSSFAAVAVPRWLFFSASRCLALCALAPRLCPRPLLCLAVFVAPAWCLGVFLFFFFSSFFFPPRAPPLSPVFSGFRPRVPWASALALFALFAFPFWALCALVALSCFPPGCWLLPRGCCPPPPLCVSRFSFRPLGAVCRVVLCFPGCGAAPRCCALCRPVFCCRVLCCARVVPLLVAPCPLVLPVALGPCALCCVCFVVARWCVLLFAALPCGVCSGVLCCAFPVLSVLCGAVFRCAGALVLCCSCGACCCWRLVLWCAAVCCAVSCGVPWCGAGSGGPWLSAGGVFRCRCPCLAAWSASLWLVWFAVVPCFPVSCSVVLCCRVVLCCCALLSCCGAVGACFALLWAVVLCCVVLLVGCAVFGLVVVSHAVRSLSSPLCALRCLVVLAVVPCFPVSCAVALCCRVVLCCRALLSFCGAVCVGFALLRPVVRRQCGLRCCWCLVLWRVLVRCGVYLGVLRCGGAALVCRGVLLCCALSCGVLRPVPCPAVPCCPAVLCCLFVLLSCLPLLKTPAVFPCL